MLRTLLSSFLFFYCNFLYGQFFMLGNADYMEGGCIQLTPDKPYSEGIAYNNAKIDLNYSFEISFDIFLGDKDEGADGITFVIHNDVRQFEAFGTYGECMGYGRWNPEYAFGNYISPSIAIEFDTYQNERQNDPMSDHVAYLENGTNFHTKFWNNKNSNFNLEDGNVHSFKFRWVPETKQIIVHLDGNVVYQGQRDLINDIFEGQSDVIWGFTASTGRKHNLQYFCLRRLAINNEDMLKEPEDLLVKYRK